MNAKLTLLSASAAVLVSALPMLAHHSFAAEYDSKNKIELKGVVTKFEWTNPHALIYLDVKDGQGIVKQWTIELMSPSQLKALGWARDIVKPGDVISCTGGRAKSGLPSMLSSSLRLSDGRTIKS